MTTRAIVGGLVPESILHTEWFLVMATFVAINTILYVSLSVLKIMPKLYPGDIFRRRLPRSETRSISPNGQSPPSDYEPEPDSLAAQGWYSRFGPEWARPPASPYVTRR